MDGQLDICTLGGLTIYRDGAPFTDFDQRKVPALLVYLACTDRAQPREVLAELFWEERTQSQSLANLRVVLSNLRKTVGAFVSITRDTAVMTTGGWWLDAVAFEECLTEAAQNLTRLEEALDLYQGDFLQGFYIDSQGFEDWALLERERLRFRAMEALDRLIDCHLNQGNYAGGIAQATRLLQLDPLREQTHRQLMHLLALSGEREAALGQYETCCRVLETEFGVQPTPETLTLYEQIRAGRLVPEPVRTIAHVAPEPLPTPVWQRPRHNLPVQSTSFVGREDDIAAIMEHLKEPDCRLLTLVGPGGMGKTRLALTVTERLVDDFAQGVFFVPLAPVTAPDDIVSALATAVQFQFYQGQDSPEQQLLNFLHEKEMLLVLDNFEHLLDGAGLVDRILASAPRITVLVTTREPLTLGWEWLYEMRGLVIPDSNQTDNLEDYSAIRLFVERARRVQPGFRLADERAHVVRICQLVEGMPLGIEIAAAWLRLMPCDAIAAELLDLESLHRDAPERHRSLRSLLDQTWQRLSPPEQDTFMKLSVFRGGFTREAAETVAQTTLPRLAMLVNKSLLHCDRASRRYSLHELLRQYALEVLCSVPAEDVAAHQRHSEYYCSFMAEQLERVKQGALKDVLNDLDNILAAWDWAVSQASVRLLGQCMQGLFWFFGQQLADEQRKRVFTQVAHGLAQQVPPHAERDAIIGQLLAIECYHTNEPGRKRELAEESLAFANASGNRPAQAFAEMVAASGFPPDESESHYRHSITLYQDLNDTWGTARSTMGLGASLHRDHMRPADALVEVETALSLFRKIQDQFGTLDALINVSNILSSLAEYGRAEQLYEEALALTSQFDPPNLQMQASILNNLAWLSTMSGRNLAEAEKQAEQAVAIRRDYGDIQYLWAEVDTLGVVKYLQGDYAAAGKLFEECFEHVHSMTDASPNHVSEKLAKLGLVAQATGKMRDAYDHLGRSLELAVDHNLPVQTIQILVYVALAFAHDGHKKRALDLLGYTIPRPAIDKLTFEETRLRAELEAEFGPEAVGAAIERGKDLDPLELAREVLAEIRQPT
jgi:predicted ATPase/DNA-binding SARP family transcriptional activator